MDFQNIEQRYAKLKQQYEAGELSRWSFEQQLGNLKAQDQSGRWWSISPETGRWVYHDSRTWVEGTPGEQREPASAAQQEMIPTPPGYNSAYRSYSY